MQNTKPFTFRHHVDHDHTIRDALAALKFTYNGGNYVGWRGREYIAVPNLKVENALPGSVVPRVRDQCGEAFVVLEVERTAEGLVRFREVDDDTAHTVYITSVDTAPDIWPLPRLP